MTTLLLIMTSFTSQSILQVPLGLDTYIPTPENNPITREKIELGKRLFFDKRLSSDGTVSCGTCHDPEHAFSDAHKTAVGVAGRTGNRRTPRIANRAYGTMFFWDGRAKSLEEQVLQPIANPREMNLEPEEAARRAGLQVAAMRDALATYVRTILSGDSPYDRAQLDSQQRAGLRLFRGKAGCAVCHAGPNLTDEKLHQTGVEEGVAIKTPSLRDVARTPPFMHDGSIATLDAVIDFYDKGGTSVTQDADIRPLHLSAAEQASLRAFLEALSGTTRDGLPH